VNSFNAVPRQRSPHIENWATGEGKSIQRFKFKRAGSRSELIKGIAGGDSNRRRYFNGWCQFVKLAKAVGGCARLQKSREVLQNRAHHETTSESLILEAIVQDN
jgi:hypothetical protein